MAELPGGAELAVQHGFKPPSAAEATRKADMINILLPDEIQAICLSAAHRPRLRAGQHPDVLARLQHSLRPDRTAEGVDALLVAPKGPGHLVRSEFVKDLLHGRQRRHKRPDAGLELAYAKGSRTRQAASSKPRLLKKRRQILFGEQVVLARSASCRCGPPRNARNTGYGRKWPTSNASTN